MYNVGLLPTITGGSLSSWPVSLYDVTVNQGGLVMSLDSSSPATYVVAGNTHQVLAKFDVLASGDNIRLNNLNLTIAGTGSLNNVQVMGNNGQLGTSRSTYTLGTAFDLNTSNSLNYLIPANTTDVITVYGDVPSTGVTGPVYVSINSGSAQSNTSYATVSVGSVTSNQLTVLLSSSNLSASLNYGLGTPAVSAGQQMAQIGSFNLTAGQVNDISLSGVSIQAPATSTVAAQLSNVIVKVNGTQIGSTQAVLSANATYTFTSAPITIAAGSNATVDVYANVSNTLGATGSVVGVVTLASVNANVVGGNAVSIGSAVTGQTVNFTTGGAITASVDGSSAQAQYVGMGVTDNSLATFRFTTDANGAANLTQLTVIDAAGVSTSTTPATNGGDFVNYHLMQGTTQLATAPRLTGGVITFNLAGLKIDVNSYATLSVVADSNSYPNATSAGTHAMWLTGFQYTTPAGTQTGSPTTVHGNLFTVYRGVLSAAQGATFTAPTSISGGSGYTVAQFALSSAQYDSFVKSVTLSNSGSVIQSSSTVVLNVYASNNPSQLLGTGTATGTGDVTITFASPYLDIPAGQTYTLIVKLGASTNILSSSNNNGSYQVSLQGVTWNDSVNDVTTLSPSVVLPIPGQSITGLSN
jgi:hypothetical protein